MMERIGFLSRKIRATKNRSVDQLENRFGDFIPRLVNDSRYIVYNMTRELILLQSVSTVNYGATLILLRLNYRYTNSVCIFKIFPFQFDILYVFY